MNEWRLKDKKTHYLLYTSNAGLIRIKCRYCEYVVIAERRHTLLALNIIHDHLRNTHSISLEDLDKEINETAKENKS